MAAKAKRATTSRSKKAAKIAGTPTVSTFHSTPLNETRRQASIIVAPSPTPGKSIVCIYNAASGNHDNCAEIPDADVPEFVRRLRG